MLLLPIVTTACTPPTASAENVVIVIADGLRREEVFGGADEALDKNGDRTRDGRFFKGDADQRRTALMPFFWHTVQKGGQIYGDQKLGSVSQVTNRLNFSYPGYSETLCGYVDPGVKSNDPRPNPNVTVFEWLSHQPGFAGKVAAFGAWDVISAVFNKQRCGFMDAAGYEPVQGCKMTPTLRQLNQLKAEQTPVWRNEVSDSIAFRSALEYVKANTPRVLFISLGETDKWAHEAKYDLYLDAAHRYDKYVAELWGTLQSMPQYKGKTTLILTCDHGRGTNSDWTTHGKNYPNSKYTWMGFIGPGTRALGEIQGSSVTNSQIASTAAAVLGCNYALYQPKAAPVIADVLR